MHAHLTQTDRQTGRQTNTHFRMDCTQRHRRRHIHTHTHTHTHTHIYSTHTHTHTHKGTDTNTHTWEELSGGGADLGGLAHSEGHVGFGAPPDRAEAWSLADSFWGAVEV